MKSLQHYVDQMNGLLGELIQIATQLRNMSFQVISEEDLAPLQKRQEDLLTQLEKIDQQLQTHYRHQVESSVQEHFHHELQRFQQLNQEFIQNLNASHGLIQFELRHLQEEGEDFSSYLSRLKKRTSAPDRSKTVESEEDEES